MWPGSALSGAWEPLPLKQLITSGVRVFFYFEDRERTFDSPADKLLMSVTALADELEREKARQRVYDAMTRKPAAGQVTGGRVFGYDNFDVLDPKGHRSHVERRINETEAAVVRRIFEMCAAGAGPTRITKMLNADEVPAPRPQQGRPVGRAHTSVRAVLLRELYRGVIVWNQTRKRDRWGQKAAAGATRGRVDADASAPPTNRLGCAVAVSARALRGTAGSVPSTAAASDRS